MSTQAKPFLTPEQYLEIERAAESKSEYFHGEMFALSGGSLNHARLVRNLSASLHSQLRGRRCEVAASDLRLRVSADGLYTYPDIVVFCGRRNSPTTGRTPSPMPRRSSRFCRRRPRITIAGSSSSSTGGSCRSRSTW